MSIANTYSANGNYKTSTTDELGNTTHYTYNEELGLLTGVEDAKENIVSYLYNSMQQNTKVSQTASNPYYNVTSLTLENNYAYNSSDSLSEISTGNGTEYEFTYDIWGNPVTASVGSTTLATYEYSTDIERKLKKITYANGQSVTFERIEDSGISWDVYYILDEEENMDYCTLAYLNDFDEIYFIALSDGSNIRVVDGITEHFVLGTGLVDPPIILHSFGENEIENGTQFLEKIGSTGITSNYTTEGNTTLASVKINEEEAQAVNQVSKTDEFGRVAASGVYQGNSIPLDSAAVVTSYSYDLPGCKTSSRVERMSIANAAEANSFYKDYFYSYDELGNILTVSEGGVQKARYEYDDASQLIRVDDAQQNLSFTYNYNAGGNILNKKTYAYTTGTLGASTDSIDYGYTDTNWKDKMTSYDGSAITYDASGNPLTYDGWEFAWEGGRQLQSMSKTGVGTLAFDYDSNGIRTSKTVNSTVTTFTVVGSQITRQQTGENSIFFFYDNEGKLISLNYADENYFYIKNLQGDIVAIADIDGNIVVEYTYDAWGAVLSTTGTLAGTLGNDNPFRYRGYYYDAEIELYYLQSRYYSPEWGRFINADGIEQVNGLNLFAFCGNNPVMFVDYTGTFFDFAKLVKYMYSTAWWLLIAKEGIYPYRFNIKNYTNHGQCVGWAKCRAQEVWGVDLGDLGISRAKQWLDLKNQAHQVVYKDNNINNLPSKSVAIFTKGYYGHVMFIEKVVKNENGEVTYIWITETNKDENGFFDPEYNTATNKVDGRLQKLSATTFKARQSGTYAGYAVKK